MNTCASEEFQKMPYQTPPPLVTILRAIEEQTAHLSKAAAKLGVARNFTLDGRLVGDIGEMLAAQYLDLTLDDTQRRGHDGVTKIEGVDYQVQVKCRKAAPMVNFSTVPELLVVIVFSEDWTEWEIVYNGPGALLGPKAVAAGLEVDADKRIRKNGSKYSLDFNLRWFRELPVAVGPTLSVPLRPQPILLFAEPAA
jgi:hypothetical protein